MSTHTQCRLRQGSTQTVSWIPSKAAIKGKTVRLKDETGWSLWEVLEVWGTKPSSWVLDGARDYKHHRKATDI
jgi:hypothetical protein